MPVTISKVEDIGRHKIVRASLEGREIAAIVGEDEEIPADPKIAFDPAGINIYADSWRVEWEAEPWKRPGTTRPGSWCCRCCCWWRSRRSSR